MRVFVALVLALSGCAVQAEPYEPDWDSGSIATGKADGLADDAPELTLGGAELSGDVGDQRMELYRVTLQRTDRIEVEMEVTDGDLNPHLTLYAGLSRYVSSESWERDGDILRKVYAVDAQGTYFLAARAYRGEGDGNYAVRARCLDGPCAGNFPAPWTELDLGDAAGCITKARRCAFEALPRYNGRVGAARSTSIFESCLNSVSLDDGSSCAAACDWEGDSDNADYDDARPHCKSIIEALPFYADVDDTCMQEFDGCMSDCWDIGSYNSYDIDDFYETTESVCFGGGFNGNCDSYARNLGACGGSAPPDGYAVCEDYCRSTSGAHTDDIQDLCGYDAGCTRDMCDVDIDAAAARCGGRSDSNRSCIGNILDDMGSDLCEYELDDLL